MAKRPAKRKDQSPAGAPAEHAAVDRRWRLYATAAVVVALVVAGLLGLVLVPAAQRENAHLDMGSAMRRAAGLEAGSPAAVQPVSGAESVPVSQVSWDPQILRILASGSTQRGAQVAAATCAACHGDKGLSQGQFPSLGRPDSQRNLQAAARLSQRRPGQRADEPGGEGAGRQ